MANPDEMLVVKFYASTKKNDTKSKAEGRPVYDDVELCEIRSPGDRNSVKVFPAHAQHRWISNPETGDQVIQTYAERWNTQYLRFKQGRQQVQEGTPLAELPFLTEAKRRELNALSVFTAEQLAGMDGANLKALGMQGREMKNQAQAYLDNATGSANVTAMAAELAELRRQVAALNVPPVPAEEAPAPAAEPTTSGDDLSDWSDADLKAFIKNETGSAPRGNPSRDTLIAMASELASQSVAA